MFLLSERGHNRQPLAVQRWFHTDSNACSWHEYACVFVCACERQRETERASLSLTSVLCARETTIFIAAFKSVSVGTDGVTFFVLSDGSTWCVVIRAASAPCSLLLCMLSIVCLCLSVTLCLCVNAFHVAQVPTRSCRHCHDACLAWVCDLNLVCGVPCH